MYMENTEPKIIYIEDDEFTRLVVKSQLEQSGFVVDDFSGIDRLNGSARKDYDLVLTDLNIEGSTPHLLVTSLRKQFDCPVVVLSASAEKVDGAALFLHKPLTEQGVIDMKALVRHHEDMVDLSRVYQFACGDEDLLYSYLTTFIQNYEHDLQLLEVAKNERNVRSLRNLAHKMQSSVAYYDQKTLVSLLHDLELKAGSYGEVEIDSACDKIDKYSRRLLNNVKSQVAL